MPFAAAHRHSRATVAQPRSPQPSIVAEYSAAARSLVTIASGGDGFATTARSAAGGNSGCTATRGFDAQAAKPLSASARVSVRNVVDFIDHLSS